MPPILFCKKQKKLYLLTHLTKNTTKKKKIVNILLIYNHKGEREDLRAAHQTHPTFEAPKNCTQWLNQLAGADHRRPVKMSRRKSMRREDRRTLSPLSHNSNLKSKRNWNVEKLGFSKN